MGHLLLIDDDEDDLFVLRRALTRAGVTDPVSELTNGQQAIEYLSGQGGYADRSRFPLPTLVFLDLKMPMRDGFEVLAWARERKELARIPIIVLTGSEEVRDNQRAYALGARSYLVKPASPGDLRAVMESLRSLLEGKP